MSNIFATSYHPQLIRMMLQASFAGSFSVNILTPLLLSALLYTYIELDHLIVWIVANITLYFLRVYFAVRTLNKLKNIYADLRKELRAIYTVIFMSSLLHGYALWYSSFRIDEMQLFFMAMVTITLVAGSISTLGSVFTAFFVYLVSNIVPILIVFILQGEDIFYIFAFAVMIFMLIMLRNGYGQFKSLEENITLKENFEARVNNAIIELKQKEKLLYEQSRLAQMGEMISMIAHQWRQPLSAISATSSSLELRAQLNTIDSEYVEKMSTNISSYAQYLSETIDDFRNFFKPDKEISSINLNKLVQSVLHIMEISLSNKNIKIIQDLRCNTNFDSYANELKQVILNLIKNAEDILVENRVQNPYIKISTMIEGDTFLLKVSDNGGGISKDALSHIFDPYFSTKKEKNGTGLGLYMSKMIVEEHCKGKLRAFNSEDGAVFIMKVRSLQ